MAMGMGKGLGMEWLLPLWGTLSALIMGFLYNIIPKEYYFKFHCWLQDFQERFTYFVDIEIHEFDAAGNNEMYDYVQTYLSSRTAISAPHIRLSRPKNATYDTFSLGHGVTHTDTFMDAKMWWTVCIIDRQVPTNIWSEVPNDERRSYSLRIRKLDKDRVLKLYVEHVIATAKLMKDTSRDRLLYTNMKAQGGYSYPKKKAWQSVPLKNPSTFATLAMDPVLKDEIKKDLEDFTKGKEFYEMAGKPWKRGYLLYGPPGTGKSSMIGAIANHLKYDIYDLELTEVKSNCELRNLLIQTTDRSILVIEDIDCTVDLAKRAKAQKESTTKDKPDREEASRVTLSGVLNFSDGLWSCCGSERIIIFTTNYLEKLDPALLRTGRMDKKIHMSYCEFPAFRTLAKNNLRLDWHDSFPKIEKAMAGKAMTPADVSELLLKKRDDPSAAFQDLLEALEKTALVSEIKTVEFDEISETANPTVDDDPTPDPPAVSEST